ncbi:MAG TPA: class I SAM-dependent methyltransferase [Thermoanaerobaculia bacterium]|nr:class I SAM-dependent methyltransferase [Thermoanaerobaculia bacterium]
MSFLNPMLHSMPAPVLRALGAVRELGLRLIGPLDELQREGTASVQLPPLWLRRHSGPLGWIESSAFEMSALIESMNQVRADDLVLDIGCGPGAMTPWFGRMLGPGGRYVGIDNDSDAIEWCRTRFRHDERFRFEIGDVSIRLGLEDGLAGFILAKSIFTHLTEAEALSCLQELRRVLSPARTALVTAFLFDGVEGGCRAAAYFPFCNTEGSVRWRWKARRRSGIAFDRSLFESLVERAGLRVALFRPGFFPGVGVPTGQDILFLAHR